MSFTCLGGLAAAVRPRQTLAVRSRYAAALGMGTGGALFGGVALLGLQAVLQAVPLLFFVLKVAGGLYLCWLGLRIFLAAAEPLNTTDADVELPPARRSFWVGLSTQVSNPKTAIVYASVFAAFMPPAVSAAFAVSLLLLVFCVEAGWYGLVAIALSAPASQKAYLSWKAAVDRTSGIVMVSLGLKLLDGAARPKAPAGPDPSPAISSIR